MAKSLGPAPPYGMRKGWAPRKLQDFADGGAFPEIHEPQYPLDMGRYQDNSNVLTIPNNADEDARAEILLRQGHDKDRIILGRPSDAEEKEMMEKPKLTEEERRKRIDEVGESFNKALQKKLYDNKVVKKSLVKPEANYILYTPAQRGSLQPGGQQQQRVIKMMEVQKDPMEPPRFQINKKIPRGPPSPPAAVMTSPTRPATKREKEMWKIPPCVSNWKNPRGYTIPLANRVAADGRNNQIVTANPKHDSFFEALKVAERQARAEIERKNQLRKKIRENEEKRDKEKLQQYAMRVREKQAQLSREGENDEERERNELRAERQRDRNREKNLGARSGNNRLLLENRDISEQIALGQANPYLNKNKDDFLIDKRLLDKTGGLDSGFSGGADDLYNIYDKPLFNQNKSVYKAPRNTEGAGELEDVSKYSKKFVLEKEARDEPVSFVNDDPFQLNEFLGVVKGTKRSAVANATAGDDDEKGTAPKRRN